MDTLTILSALIHDHVMSSHLLISSIISFISILQFSDYMSYLLRQIYPQVFHSFKAIVKEIVSLISSLNFCCQCLELLQILCINFVSSNISKFIMSYSLFLFLFSPGGIYRTSMYQFSSVAQSCQTLCDPMNCSTPGLPVHQQLLEFIQTHVH